MKQPESGRERPVGDTVHDGTPQVTALADAKAQDNDRIDVRHGQAADEGHQGSRIEGGRAGDGVQADRVRPAPLARGERPAPGRARPGRGGLRQRQARRATWRGCLTSRITRSRRAAADGVAFSRARSVFSWAGKAPSATSSAPVRCRAGVATAEPATTARLNGTSVMAAASGLSCRVPCKYKAARVLAELVAACSGMRRWFRGAAAGTATRPGQQGAAARRSAMRNAAVSGAVSPAMAKAGAGAWAWP